jgi:hypothetical protein
MKNQVVEGLAASTVTTSPVAASPGIPTFITKYSTATLNSNYLSSIEINDMITTPAGYAIKIPII